MSLTLLNVHKHKISFSYCKNVSGNSSQKYMVNELYTIEKSKSYVIKENDYVHLNCNECNYIYRTDKK